MGWIFWTIGGWFLASVVLGLVIGRMIAWSNGDGRGRRTRRRAARSLRAPRGERDAPADGYHATGAHRDAVLVGIRRQNVHGRFTPF